MHTETSIFIFVPIDTIKHDHIFVGMLGDLFHERRDIGWGNLFDTLDRHEIMSFSEWYSLDTVCALVPKTNSYPKIRSLILPFDDYIWTCLIFILVNLGVLFAVFSKFQVDNR